jgi:hypothetical protein
MMTTSTTTTNNSSNNSNSLVDMDVIVSNSGVATIYYPVTLVLSCYTARMELLLLDCTKKRTTTAGVDPVLVDHAVYNFAKLGTNELSILARVVQNGKTPTTNPKRSVLGTQQKLIY